MNKQEKSLQSTNDRVPSPGATPHILILSARFYDDISDALEAGAISELNASGATHDIVHLPGALEIPQAFAQAVTAGRFANSANKKSNGLKEYDGVVALGCVVRGETFHFEIVCNNANHWLMEIATRQSIPVGNGVLTVETREQALARAEGGRQSKGADAARACLRLIEVARNFEECGSKGLRA